MAWGKVEVVKAPKLQDIMNDQGVFPDVNFTRQEEDNDYQFALMMQEEEMRNAPVDTSMTEDQYLAECMQRIENEEASLERNIGDAQQSGEFSKISVKQNNVHGIESKKKPFVTSSGFHDALQLEHSLHHSSRDVQQLFKHDLLLQGLSNSASLSELDGVGDLLGSKLMVSNTVANSLKTFVHKNEDRQIQKKMNKCKKGASAVPLVLKAHTTAVPGPQPEQLVEI